MSLFAMLKSIFTGGYIVIRLKCPFCNKEGKITHGEMEFEPLGKDTEGYLYFKCSNCGKHLKYDSISGRIAKSKKDTPMEQAYTKDAMDVDEYFILMSVLLTDIAKQLKKTFDGEAFNWKISDGEKAFECLILSKFLVTHAFLTAFDSKMDEGRIMLNLTRINHIFEVTLSNNFGNEFNVEDLRDTIQNRLSLYRSAIVENPHPRCWQIIAGICTGIDYYGQKDLLTQVSSTIILGNLLIIAQKALKEIIKNT